MVLGGCAEPRSYGGTRYLHERPFGLSRTGLLLGGSARCLSLRCLSTLGTCVYLYAARGRPGRFLRVPAHNSVGSGCSPSCHPFGRTSGCSGCAACPARRQCTVMESDRFQSFFASSWLASGWVHSRGTGYAPRVGVAYPVAVDLVGLQPFHIPPRNRHSVASVGFVY